MVSHDVHEYTHTETLRAYNCKYDKIVENGTVAANHHDSMMYYFIDTPDGFAEEKHGILAFEDRIETTPETYVKKILENTTS